MDALCEDCLIEWWNFVAKPEHKWMPFKKVWNAFLKTHTVIFR